MDNFITIINSKDQRYAFNRKYISYLNTLKDMLEDTNIDEKVSNIDIVLQYAEVDILPLIGKFS